MCGVYLCACGAETMLTIAVSYCHDERRWRVHHCATSLTADGIVREHGSVHREFGPFDDYRDVQEFLSEVVKNALPCMTEPSNLTGS